MSMKLIFAALVATALLVAPAAHADGTDSQFLGQLAGINLPPDQAISCAHQICDAEGLPRFGIGSAPPLVLGL
jgi:hypothetical protein